MKRRIEVSIPGRRLPPLLVPWLAYVGVTVAAPAANGAWRRSDFAEHAALTIGASALLLGACRAIARRRRKG